MAKKAQKKFKIAIRNIEKSKEVQIQPENVGHNLEQIFTEHHKYTLDIFKQLNGVKFKKIKQSFKNIIFFFFTNYMLIATIAANQPSLDLVKVGCKNAQT